MARPSENKDNPLQCVRLAVGMTQQEFADALGVSKSEISKRETSTPGYATLPSSLLRRLIREFAVVIGSGANPKPRGINGETFDKKYADDYRRQWADPRPVKCPPRDLLKALELVAAASEKLKQEESLAHAMEQAVKVLCLSPRLGHEIASQLKQFIKVKNPDDLTAVHWLAGVIKKPEMVQDLPAISQS